MSQIIVNIPDCATGSHDDHDVITVTTEGCPAAPAGPPPLIPGYGWFLGFVVIIAVIIAIGVVRWKRIDDDLPSRADRKLELRKAELDARARIAEARNSCQNCGVVYAPKLEDIK